VNRNDTHLDLPIFAHVVDVPLAVSIDALQGAFQQRRVVQVVDHEVESEDDARVGLAQEVAVLGQLSDWNIGEFGEQGLRLGVSLEVSVNRFILIHFSEMFPWN
jgi:hypothetical protein